MPKKYPKDQRERATRMALDRLEEYRSPWAAAQALGPRLGVGPETLRKWIVFRRSSWTSTSFPCAGVEFWMTSTVAVRRPTRRQVRDLQRTAHLLAAVVLLAYVYASPLLGAGFTAAVRWLVVPALVMSGVALWQWHRLRTTLRKRKG